MVTTSEKLKIVDALKAAISNYPSADKFAEAIGIAPSQLSRIMKGDVERVISDAKWAQIKSNPNIALGAEFEWKTVKTETYEYVYGQLEACQAVGMSALLCDSADLGKSHAAKVYAPNHKNCIYIDCSQHKTKQRLIRAIAKAFGVKSEGKYADLYDRLVAHIKTLHNPMIILDEVGDLDYAAFLEIKAMWNALQNVCAWYMMGADGLKAKIELNLGNNKVGYAEIFSRFGTRYQRVSPESGSDIKDFKLSQFAAIAKANSVKGDVMALFVKCNGSLRKLYDEAKKQTLIARHG